MSDCDFWEKSCLIYVITDLINGMQYVGQTVNKLKRRIGHHKKYNESYLGDAIRKYGWENFKVDILEECKAPEESDEREIFWIKQLNCKIPNGYNMTDGGNVPRGRVVSDKERKLEAEMNPYKRAFRCIDTGEIFPSVMSVERRFKAGHSTVSAVCKESQKLPQDIDLNMLTVMHQKFIKPRKTHAIRVRCIETNEIFPSIKEAARRTKAYPCVIKRVCQGKGYTSGGYHWEYV